MIKKMAMLECDVEECRNNLCVEMGNEDTAKTDWIVFAADHPYNSFPRICICPNHIKLRKQAAPF